MSIVYLSFSGVITNFSEIEFSHNNLMVFNLESFQTQANSINMFLLFYEVDGVLSEKYIDCHSDDPSLNYHHKCNPHENVFQNFSNINNIALDYLCKNSECGKSFCPPLELDLNKTYITYTNTYCSREYRTIYQSNLMFSYNFLQEYSSMILPSTYNISFFLTNNNNSLFSISLNTSALEDPSILEKYLIIKYSQGDITNLQPGIEKNNSIIFKDLSNKKIVDAIISIDQLNLFILSNKINCEEKCIGIYVIDIYQILSLTEVSPFIIEGDGYAETCNKIIEYKSNSFILNCLSSKTYKSRVNLLGDHAEIFYLLEYQNLSMTYSSSIYIEEFFQKTFTYIISSALPSNDQSIFISGWNFYYTFTIKLNNQISDEIFFENNLKLLIKTASYSQNIFYYGGCELDSISNKFNAILFIVDNNNHLKHINNYSHLDNSTCIESQLIDKFSQLFFSLSSTSDYHYYLIYIYKISKNNSILIKNDPQISLQQEIPILFKNENQIIQILVQNNQSSGSLFIYSQIFDLNLQSNGEINIKESKRSGKFPNLNVQTCFPRTALLNINNELSLGGYCTILNSNFFWIAHYDFQGNLTSSYEEGLKGYNSKALVSSYISKRIQIFGGYLKAAITDDKFQFNQKSFPIYYFVTENGNYLQKKTPYLPHNAITSFQKTEEYSINSYLLYSYQAALQITLKIQVTCNDSYLIDQIEYGCFRNCLNNVDLASSQECNPSVLGCSESQKIMENFFCKSDRLINKKYRLNNSVISSINNHQIVIDRGGYKYLLKNLSLKITKNNKAFFTREIKISEGYPSSNFISLSLKELPELNCASEIDIYGIKKDLENTNSVSLSNPLLSTNNSDTIPCEEVNSQLTNVLLHLTKNSMTFVSGILFGSSIIALNPVQIISIFFL